MCVCVCVCVYVYICVCVYIYAKYFLKFSIFFTLFYDVLKSVFIVKFSFEGMNG